MSFHTLPPPVRVLGAMSGRPPWVGVGALRPLVPYEIDPLIPLPRFSMSSPIPRNVAQPAKLRRSKNAINSLTVLCMACQSPFEVREEEDGAASRRVAWMALSLEIPRRLLRPSPNPAFLPFLDHVAARSTSPDQEEGAARGKRKREDDDAGPKNFLRMRFPTVPAEIADQQASRPRGCVKVEIGHKQPGQKRAVDFRALPEEQVGVDAATSSNRLHFCVPWC